MGEATRRGNFEQRMGAAINRRKSFELGKFYLHDKGRCIAIVAEIETYMWGEIFVVEETDHTGHGISCIEKDAEINDNWTEVGREEWLRNFEGEKAG